MISSLSDKIAPAGRISELPLVRVRSLTFVLSKNKFNLHARDGPPVGGDLRMNWMRLSPASRWSPRWQPPESGHRARIGRPNHRRRHRPRAGAPISNVLVSIAGTTLGNRSGTDGRFTIANVPAGPQRLHARALATCHSTKRSTSPPDKASRSRSRSRPLRSHSTKSS